MNLAEMKLAVCEKLPELVTITPFGGFDWKQHDWTIQWPTEGLQVCHEAEKLLTGYNKNTGDSEYGRYITTLQKITNWNRVPCATYEQRLEALCRVWWPERFA